MVKGVLSFQEASWGYIANKGNRAKAADFPLFNGEVDLSYQDVLNWHPCLDDRYRQDIISYIEWGYEKSATGKQARIEKLRLLHNRWQGKLILLERKPEALLHVNFVGPWAHDDLKSRRYTRHPEDPQISEFYVAVSIEGVGYFLHLGLEHVAPDPVETPKKPAPLIQPWTLETSLQKRELIRL